MPIIHKDLYNSVCCESLTAPLNPKELCCFLPDICKKLNYLKQRHKSLITKRRIYHDLAVPNRVAVPYIKKCACMRPQRIEIVNLEEPERTRTEQLALPGARKLLIFRENVSKKFSEARLNVVNKYLRRSLLSLYNRFAGAKPPEPVIPKTKWTREEWRSHRHYLKKLSKPKKGPKQPKIKKTKAKSLDATRFINLAKPKVRMEVEKDAWKFTPAMKMYEASDNLLNLAKPKIKEEDFITLPIKVPPNALKYKATEEIKKLAEPTSQRAGESDLKENPFSIAPNALKAKATKRTIELAEPKEFEDTHTRPNPNAISPAALNAKASPRTIELAKPKGS